MELDEQEYLKDFFQKSYKGEMTYIEFTSFCQTFKLIDPKFNFNDINVIFTRIKSRDKKTINFKEFKGILLEISMKKKNNVIEDIAVFFNKINKIIK